MKEHRGDTPQPVVLGVTAEERAQCRQGDYSWHKAYWSIACNMKVWDEGYGFDKGRRHEIVVETDRRGFCFFWPYHPGMLLPAAKTLQERGAATLEARRDRRLTIWGLWIAGVALMIDVTLRALQWFIPD